MQNLLFFNSRKTFGVLGTSSLGLIIVALIFEHALLLKALFTLLCPKILCISSTIAFAYCFLTHKNQSLNLFRTYLGLSIAVIASGISLSLRQLYLQSLPADLVPTCGPDIDYLFETLPVLEVFMLAIRGDGNCAEVLWSFLGVSIPGWLLIAFVVLFLLRYSIFIFFKGFTF